MHESENTVYHGSHAEFDSELANPKRQIRQRQNEEGNFEVIFDEESFHATPHKWIALAYTYKSVPHEIDRKIAHYNMGVSLYENTHQVTIYGFNNLEDSLEKLYGNGGYIYHFDRNKFIYKEGLGNLEVIVNEPTKPIEIERVDNPVEEMKKLGVTFKFVDLGLSENEDKRNHF